jgi:putative ABC transport system substrate-binding protein
VKQFWILDFGFSIAQSKNKKLFCFALSAILFAVSFTVEAQQAKKVHRIGFLAGASASYTAAPIEAFREQLRLLGWVEGQNITIEYRYADGKLDRLSDLAADLVHLKFDIIVTSNDIAAGAAKKLTGTIPIVMAGTGDPLGEGLVASLARPGGNVTGVTALSPELSTKRLELLRERSPRFHVWPSSFMEAIRAT